MSSASSEKFRVDCPHCRKKLRVPPGMRGKTAKCPSCQGMMTVPAMDVAEPPVIMAEEVDDLRLQPAAPRPSAPQDDPLAAFNISSESMTQRAHRLTAADEGGGGVFAPEKKGLDAGMIGGALMMIIAVVWFIVGWAAGVIFFYPPILFIIGLFGFLKGLFTGNVTGNRNTRSRY